MENPYAKLEHAVKQMEDVRTTTELVRNTIKVVNICEKIRNITSPQAQQSSSAANSTSPSSAATKISPSTSTSPSSPASLLPPSSPSLALPSSLPLRDLVKCAALWHEVDTVFAGTSNGACAHHHPDMSGLDLSGIEIIDPYIPFLQQLNQLIHNQGRKALDECMRSGGGGAAPSGSDSSSPSIQLNLNQVDLSYVMQLFYNLEPNTHVTTTLRLLQRMAHAHSAAGHANGKSAARRRKGDETNTSGMDVLLPFIREVDLSEQVHVQQLLCAAGGMELVSVLDERVASFMQQARTALTNILDIAAHATSAHDMKRSRGRKTAAGQSAAPSSSPPSASSLRSLVWERLDSFINLLFVQCIQVWTLAKLLHEKRDLVHNDAPGCNFEEIVCIQRCIRTMRTKMEESDEKTTKGAGTIIPTQVLSSSDLHTTLLDTFWSALCSLLRSEFDPISSSAPSSSPSLASSTSGASSVSTTSSSAHTAHNFIRTIFVNEYPRLHALFSRLFERLQSYCNSANASMAATDAARSGRNSTSTLSAFHSSQSDASSTPPPMLSDDLHRPQLLSCLLPFMQLYLSRTLNAVNEPVALMFPSNHPSGAAAPVPSRADVSTLIRAITDAVSGVSEFPDPYDEVQKHVCKAVSKSIASFEKHCRSMMIEEMDRDMFGSTQLTAAMQREGMTASAAIGRSGHSGRDGASGASGAPPLSASTLSSIQRTNFDIFIIALQVERAFSEGELMRQYPGLFAANDATPAASSALPHSAGLALPSSPTTLSSPSPSAALTHLRSCFNSVRSLAIDCISLLCSNVVHHLTPHFMTLLPGESGSETEAEAALMKLLQQLSSSNSSQSETNSSMQGLKRKIAFCTNILFPLYAQHVLIMPTISNNTSPVVVAATENDLASRIELWNRHLLHPLYAQLLQHALRILALHPLALPTSRSELHPPLRAHVLNQLGTIDAMLKTLIMQSQIHMERVANGGALGVNGRSIGGDSSIPIPSLDAFKQLLFAPSMDEYRVAFSSKSVEPVTLLHFLFSTCTIKTEAQPHSSTNATPASDNGDAKQESETAVASAALSGSTSPHRLLGMKLEEYMRAIATKDHTQLMQLFQSAFAVLEGRISSSSAASSSFASDTSSSSRALLDRYYPKLQLASSIIEKCMHLSARTSMYNAGNVSGAMAW